MYLIHSLTALGTDYIDLLLIHRPSCMMDADEVTASFNILGFGCF